MANSITRVERPRHIFHTLNGLRGIAAIAVVAGHYGAFFAPLSVGSGWLAVDLFFVISGFVIGHIYDQRLKLNLSLPHFMAHRLIRLYPLYLLGTLIGLGVTGLGFLIHIAHGWTPTLVGISMISSLLMLPVPPNSLIGDTVGPFRLSPLYPLNGPAWSLFFELLINIAYAAALRFRRDALLPIAMTLSAGALVTIVIFRGTIMEGFLWDGFHVGLTRVTYSFVAGVLISRAHAAGKLFHFRVPPILCLVAVGVLLVFTPGNGLQRQGYDAACVLVIFPAIVSVAVGLEPLKTVPLYEFLGETSYPLYIIHIPLLYIFNFCINRFLPHGEPWSGFLIVATLLLLSWILARTYDPKARAALGKIVFRTRPTRGIS